MNNKNLFIINIIASVILILFIVFMGIALAGQLADTGYRDDKYISEQIAQGRYANAYIYFLTLKNITSTEGAEYNRYIEFKEFYDYYIDYLIYSAIPDDDNAYNEKINTALDSMERIKDESTFSENIPHYEYMLEK